MICSSSNLVNLSWSLERHMQIQGDKLCFLCTSKKGYLKEYLGVEYFHYPKVKLFQYNRNTTVFQYFKPISKSIAKRSGNTWRGPLLLLRQRRKIPVSRINVKSIPGYMCSPTSKKNGKLSFYVSSWKSEGERSRMNDCFPTYKSFKSNLVIGSF